MNTAPSEPEDAARSGGIPPSVRVGGAELVLNGRATRKVFGFGIYEAALFVGERTSDGGQIMAGDPGPKRIQMLMLREVGEEKFVSAVEENIERNFSSGERERFGGELRTFLDSVRGEGTLPKGRSVTVDYVPGEGTVVSCDVRVLARIPGSEFYHALLRLWIGDPLQSSIREGLLGKGQ